MIEYKPIGILGGMGPEAGVHFQKLILDKTPAEVDQAHIKSVLYTNPHILDRTTAILQGREEDFVDTICESLQMLEKLGVSELFIPCNTSFVGYGQYCSQLKTPLYNLPKKTIEYLQRNAYTSAHLLATLGTYTADVYPSTEAVEISKPGQKDMDMVHALISAVKGRTTNQSELLADVAGSLDTSMVVILGCTELSIIAAEFRLARPDIVFVDPLEIAAEYIVRQYAPANLQVIG